MIKETYETLELKEELRQVRLSKCEFSRYIINPSEQDLNEFHVLLNDEREISKRLSEIEV